MTAIRPAEAAARTGRPARVLVTGGAGFIGRAVVARLTAAGAGRRRAGLPARRTCIRMVPRRSLPPSVRLDVGDVRDRDQVARALSGVDVVVHLAAKVGLGVDLGDLDDYVSSNDLGTAVLVQEMARAAVGRLVVASSMVVYGEGAYRCAEHGSRAAGRAPGGRPARRDASSPAVRSAAPPLAPELVDEDAPLIPETAMPQRNCTKSIWRRMGPRDWWSGRGAAVPQCLRPRPAARTRPTPGSRRSSRRRCGAARRRGSSRTAASAATSSTSRRRRELSLPRRIRPRSCRPADCVLQRRQWHRPHDRRPGRGDGDQLGRSAARDHRRVPARRRPPCDRVLGPDRATSWAGRPAVRVPGRHRRLVVDLAPTASDVSAGRKRFVSILSAHPAPAPLPSEGEWRGPMSRRPRAALPGRGRGAALGAGPAAAGVPGHRRRQRVERRLGRDRAGVRRHGRARARPGYGAACHAGLLAATATWSRSSTPTPVSIRPTCPSCWSRC